MRWKLPLRRWQEEAIQKYRQHKKIDFLCNVTPGGGKTIWALRAAFEQLASGKAQRLVICSPTEQIKYQWERAAASVGIHLNPEFSNNQKRWVPDFHGIVCTYAQIANKPSLFRAICQVPTMLIADEIHHCGDGLAYGVGLQEGFQHAVARLLLTGTAFRSDDNFIPFVRYDNNISVADYVYSYRDGLEDGILRPVVFASYGGKMKWEHDGQIREASFQEQLDRRGRSHRLQTAISASGGWASEIIRDANALLDKITTNGHRSAAGLIITQDQNAAREVGQLVRTITGHQPVIVVSDDPASRKKLEAFTNNNSRWIVAVRMVSEGVDMPRLRVGVYLTNITAELFFRQAVGRVIRQKAPHPTGDAYFFIPRDPRLVSLAEKIEKERRHAVTPKQVIKEDGNHEGETRQLSLFQPIAAQVEQRASLIVDGNTLHLSQPLAAVENIDDLTVRERRKAVVNKEIRVLVGRVINQSKGKFTYWEVYSWLNRQQKVQNQESCTLEQLEERVQMLRNRVSMFAN